MEHQVELSAEQAAADPRPDEGVNTTGDIDPACRSPAPAEDTGGDAPGSRVCCGVRQEALWGAALWSTYVNLFLFLPRLIILPGLFINIVRGPVYGFFVHPLWALVHCACTALLLLSRDNRQEEQLGDPFGLSAAAKARFGLALGYVNRAKDAVSVSRKNAAIVSLVWIFVDWIFTALTFAISLGFCLIVFTEWDGALTAGYGNEYAVLMVGVVFCGMSLLCQLVSFVSLALFLCAGCGKAPVSAAHSEPLLQGTDGASPPPQTQEQAQAQAEGETDGPEQPSAVAAGGSTAPTGRQCCAVAPQTKQALNTSAVIYMLAVSLAAVVLLSFCIHDSLRGQYYEAEADAEYESCDGLVPLRCALPFPSSFWLARDDATATGFRVSLNEKTLPYTWRGQHVNPSIMNRFDGFSVSAPLLWHLGGVRSKELVSFEYVERSRLTNSTTLLVRADGLQLHPHFSEIDLLDDDPESRIQYTVPATALDFNHTYVVIVQGLTNGKGQLIQPSWLWNKYRDAYTSGDDTALANDERYLRFKSVVFPVIIALNLTMEEVQLAWDFRTSSFESISEQLVHAADVAVVRTQQVLDDYGMLPYDLIKIDEEKCTADSADTHKMSAIAYYRMDLPWFLVNLDRVGNTLDSSLLSLSVTDDVAIRNQVPLSGSVGILIQVPCSLTRGYIENVSAIVEFGHGIFGNRGIATDDWLQKSANEEGWIVWSADWRGLSTVDVLGLWRLATHDMLEFKNVEAGLVQSFVSKTVFRMILPIFLQREGCRLGLCKIDSLAASAEHITLNGNDVTTSGNRNLRRADKELPARQLSSAVSLSALESIDTAYIGHSLGAIIGTSWAIFTGYTRSAQIAGGSPFSFIMGRSAAFSLMKLAFDLQFYKRADIRIALSAWQCGLDIFESSGWKNSDRLQGISILSLNVLGDATVTGLSSQILAANINATLLEPSVTDLLLVPGEASPITRVDAKVMFQAESERDQAKIAKNSAIPASNDVHNCLLYEDALIELHNQYISEGVSANPCGGEACIFPGYMHC